MKRNTIKRKRLKTIESGLKTKKQNDSSPFPTVSDLIVTYKTRIPCPQALDAPFPFKKDKQRDDIIMTFMQVKANLSLLEVIKYILLMLIP